MKYYSTNRQSPAVDFKEATILGQAPDKGLYFPENIPVLDKNWFDRIEKMSDEEIALDVIKPYVASSIPDDQLKRIVKETLSFDIPLVKLNDTISSLELFHGPTLAFKDVGARFMSRCLGYFLSGESRKVTVLVATSGDTGGAVANGFLGVEGVEVVILYPSGKVSPAQEKQLTTLGKNIKALEVDGSFDDCQQLVKQAFADEKLRSSVFLTSANSINVARWLPQQFYYFLAWKQWKDKNNPPVVAVPSGNFGNICAGILSNASGLPVKHFIAACNVNDVVSGYLETGNYQPRTAVPTLSNAMDVGNPSNFVRILEIFHHELPELKKKLSADRITDEETMNTIREIYNNDHYLADPHGAVGYLALQRYLQTNEGQKGYFLETAHPVKFPAAVEEATGKAVKLPSSLQSLMEQKKKSLFIKPDYNHLRSILLA
ncbi:MAG: threonine synthase [Citrobacter freundii]|nr:MAG: threonine synthase [Citrobacter freundii]